MMNLIVQDLRNQITHAEPYRPNYYTRLPRPPRPTAAPQSGATPRFKKTRPPARSPLAAAAPGTPGGRWRNGL